VRGRTTVDPAQRTQDVAAFFSNDVVVAGVDTVFFGTTSVKGREQQIEVCAVPAEAT
jgi:hypothetical protein